MDSIPVLSQLKSGVQLIKGNREGAKETQVNFSKRCIGVSQFRSACELLAGDNNAARETQKEFLESSYRTATSLPVVGHTIGVAHYVVGDKELGDSAMTSASNTVGNVVGGVVGGTVGAVSVAVKATGNTINKTVNSIAQKDEGKATTNTQQIEVGLDTLQLSDESRSKYQDCKKGDGESEHQNTSIDKDLMIFDPLEEDYAYNEPVQYKEVLVEANEQRILIGYPQNNGIVYVDPPAYKESYVSPQASTPVLDPPLTPERIHIASSQNKRMRDNQTRPQPFQLTTQGYRTAYVNSPAEFKTRNANSPDMRAVFSPPDTARTVHIHPSEQSTVYINPPENKTVYVHPSGTRTVFVNSPDSKTVYVNPTEQRPVYISAIDGRTMYANPPGTRLAYAHYPQTGAVYFDPTEQRTLCTNPPYNRI
ncbi:hypothetical protein SK128_014927 [Halocaridina rubra]|uniref:Uncharacterized protein n=1 Tax=Halocaridina rubra TaxID=373956 RepID=A0AAN8XRV6_HALRR